LKKIFKFSVLALITFSILNGIVMVLRIVEVNKITTTPGDTIELNLSNYEEYLKLRYFYSQTYGTPSPDPRTSTGWLQDVVTRFHFTLSSEYSYDVDGEVVTEEYFLLENVCVYIAVTNKDIKDFWNLTTLEGLPNNIWNFYYSDENIHVLEMCQPDEEETESISWRDFTGRRGSYWTNDVRNIRDSINISDLNYQIIDVRGIATRYVSVSNINRTRQ